MAYSHCTVLGQGQVRGTRPGLCALIYCTELFTLVRDRDRNQDQLFSIVPVQFPVVGPIPFPSSLNVLLHQWMPKSNENLVGVGIVTSI